MSAANGSTVPGETVTNIKGKGKAVEQPRPAQNDDMSMDEDEDTSEGESGNDETVSEPFPPVYPVLVVP